MFTFMILGSLAQAAYTGPLLVKEANTGFTPPEYAQSQKCEVYADKTVLTIRFGSSQVLSVATKNQTLEGPSNELLLKAQSAVVETKAGPVDGPTVRYYGFLINPNDSVSKVLLFEENGGNGQILNNTATEAVILRQVIESSCPGTLQGLS